MPGWMNPTTTADSAVATVGDVRTRLVVTVMGSVSAVPSEMEIIAPEPMLAKAANNNTEIAAIGRLILNPLLNAEWNSPYNPYAAGCQYLTRQAHNSASKWGADCNHGAHYQTLRRAGRVLGRFPLASAHNGATALREEALRLKTLGRISEIPAQ